MHRKREPGGNEKKSQQRNCIRCMKLQVKGLQEKEGQNRVKGKKIEIFYDAWKESAEKMQN